MKTNKVIVDNFEITEYNSSIFVVNNVIDTALCNRIISFMDNSEEERKDIMKGNNVECFEVIYDEYNEIIKIINERIFTILNIFSKALEIEIIGTTKLQLRKVFGETILHTDGACVDNVTHPYNNIELKSVRILTLVGMLNDNYEGGIYNFPKQEVSIKLTAGSIILFPPYWTHPHSVSKIIKKENELAYRYIYSCWAMDNFLVITNNEKNINNIITIK
jgi:predicted 2-oxoglutarate/Fe(II)-dependent dioxygenase YbiX